MASAAYKIKIKKFITNPLLERKQFALDVVHPGRANVPKEQLREQLAKLYKVADPSCIILFGFRTAFGGGRSSGFGLIYDNIIACKRFEQRYRLIRFGLAEKNSTIINRRQKKDLKTKQKKLRGKEKAKVARGQKS